MPELEWRITDTPVAYLDAVAEMEDRVQAIHEGRAPELVWLLEHPPLYTAGTSSNHNDLLNAGELPVYQTGRGGQYTYHGPGQRIAYVLLNLRQRGPDVRAFIKNLETWIIDTLWRFNLRGETRQDRVGVWIDHGDGREEKIAAIGVRLRRWISYHGISINLSPDLSHYDGIVPCGIREHGVTSFEALGHTTTMSELDSELQYCFNSIFEDNGLSNS